MSTSKPTTPSSSDEPSRKAAASAGARLAATKVAATVDSWKRKLLDLTKRNRALNFRASKVSTVTIVDEQPAEVFNHICVRERPMKFKAAPESVTRSSTSMAAAPTVDREFEWGTNDATEDPSVLAPDFAPYDPSRLDERHTDEWLQTTSTPEALDKSLRRLDEQARLSMEEQGVNTLFLALGMLHYRESADSDVVIRAPLVLLPVELSRRSARSGFSVAAADDEPLVNPALVEYLRRDHGISLPELPDTSSMPEDYDLQAFLSEVSAALSRKPEWAVKTEICLALFSFQKFVMYKDLEANSEALQQHRLIRQLVTRDSDGATQVPGLPPEIRELDLDKDYPPESTSQVVDADSSQLRAIAAAARNLDLVIEGPPGTGKSQTITNLIAQALDAGKTVLFVAEKMAALEVVHSRLVEAGLGEFCLELHSTKASKLAVMKALGGALDASLQSVAAPTVATERLPKVRATLSKYVNAVHGPHGSLKMSPFRAYGELGSVISAPRVNYDGPVDGDVTRDQLAQTVRELGDLAVTAAAVGTTVDHPWRETGRTYYTSDDLEAVEKLATDLLDVLDEVSDLVEAAREDFGLPPVETLTDVDSASKFADVLAQSPGAPLAVLTSDAWNKPPAEASALLKRGREMEQLRTRLMSELAPDVLDEEHADDIAFVEQKLQGMFGFLAFLDGRFRSIRKRWIGYRLPGNTETLAEQAKQMRLVDHLRAELAAIRGLEQSGHDLFGDLWAGEKSDWQALEKYVKWVVKFRGYCMRQGLAAKAMEAAVQPAPDVSLLSDLREAAADARSCLDRLRKAVQWPEAHLEDATLQVLADRARALSTSLDQASAWAALEAARQTAADSLARKIVPLAMRGELPFSELQSAFLRAFYLKWITQVVQARPVLEKFNGLTHEERVREFRGLDKRVLLENRSALVGAVRARLQDSLLQPHVASQMPYLRKELARQRGLRPLRRTMIEAGNAVRAIKPCFMMSPLTVAQLLSGSAPAFDLVIFDEASQLPAEDAVGAILRCKQLVVVGDPKQLPPTTFFSSTSGSTETALGEDGQPLVEDSESILEEYMGAGVPMSRLKWHYRSAHESLIRFSNVQFYASDLYTFPSVETGTGRLGLQFEYLPDGVYEGKGLNAVEARRVAEEVVRFAKEQLDREARGAVVQSLGVGTFNLRQQLAIQDELEQRRRDDPSVEPFFDRGRHEPFFVKNLENIQGDERDVIFISVTYAKATDGRLRHTFGPMNGENGWRRLNVLATRARQRMRVFSSMRGDEIDAASTASRGAKLLREFLVFAEHDRIESVSASAAADTESPFEQDVLRELSNRGINLVPQVGVAGYRIDLGVLDDELPGRFVCGIECDGVAYHSSESARDRDRLRQKALEDRGWTIIRVWSTDWFKDRTGQIDRLLKLIQSARERARAEAESDREERKRVVTAAPNNVGKQADSVRREPMTLSAGEGPPDSYVRPTAAPYVATMAEGQYASTDILAAPLSLRVPAVVSVVQTEGPIHEADLLARVASMWGNRVGSRIQSQIREACNAAEQSRAIQRRGEFYWNAKGSCVLRSRTGTGIPAERIAPEEYEMAVFAVLGTGHGFSRTQLTTEVRAVLGFNRTGAVLDEVITEIVSTLMSRGRIGEASTGIRLRR